MQAFVSSLAAAENVATTWVSSLGISGTSVSILYGQLNKPDKHVTIARPLPGGEGSR